LGLKPPCGHAFSYRGDKFGVRHPGVADAASPKKPGVDRDATTGMYAMADVLHGLAEEAARHTVSAAFCSFLAVGAFRGFAKGGFGPFVTASLPGGLVAAFFATYLGHVDAMARRD
jgi:hypothetical protein